MSSLLYQSLEHAQTLKKHGKAFEQMASNLKGRLLTGGQAALIEDAGQQIQNRSQFIKELAERSLQQPDLDCLETCLEVRHHQSQAVLFHLVAIKVLVQAIKDSLLP